MGSHNTFVGTLSVTAGTDSNVLAAKELQMARKIIFDLSAKPTLAGVLSLYVAMRKGALYAAHAPLRRFPDAADVTLTAAKVNEVEVGGFESIAFKIASADTVSIPVYAVLEY